MPSKCRDRDPEEMHGGRKCRVSGWEGIHQSSLSFFYTIVVSPTNIDYIYGRSSEDGNGLSCSDQTVRSIPAVFSVWWGMNAGIDAIGRGIHSHPLSVWMGAPSKAGNWSTELIHSPDSGQQLWRNDTAKCRLVQKVNTFIPAVHLLSGEGIPPLCFLP